MKKTLPTLFVSIVSGIAMINSLSVLAADPVLPDYEVSPNIYKVIAENDDMRLIEATWAPGMKDEMHSHPGAFAVYVVNDCQRKLTKPDGTVNEKKLKAGKGAIKKPVKAHVFENIGDKECRLVLVELKK